jgi:hypothetical protein
MTRIFFVGIHNKPGLTPLHSSTRSGKLIDRIIGKLTGIEMVKTNLFDCEYLPPNTPGAVYMWRKRVEYQTGDITIGLGGIVHEYFSRYPYKNYIALGHPSCVWSHAKQDEYIARAVAKIQFKINQLQRHESKALLRDEAPQNT